MKKIIIFTLTILSQFSLSAQKPDSDKILEDGIYLYNLETASWMATEDMIANYGSLTAELNGYLSYEMDDYKICTIFYGAAPQNTIMLRYIFDMEDIYNTTVEEANSEPTKKEKELINLRSNALSQIATNKGQFFSFYENTEFNLIPIITDEERKVYIITAPLEPDIILLGNDYLLIYDKKNKLKSKTKLHNSLITLQTETPRAVASMHTHIISDFIDPTDICTLLLYREYTNWRQHYVINKKYVSVFDLDEVSLVIMTREEWNNARSDNQSKQE